jgi:nitroreductase
VITEAALAPSGGNVQPWRFELCDRTILCHLDPERASTFLDFESLASYLALGAAAENAELAAKALGYPATAKLLPDPANPELAWSLTLPTARTEPAPDPLHRYVTTRVTNRRLAARAPLPEGAAEALQAAAAERGAHLQLLDQPAALDEIGQILGEGERFRLLHRTLHDQMMAELRWTAEETQSTRDGLELASLELSATDAAGLRVASRWEAMAEVAALDGGRRLTESSEKSVAAASAVGLLTLRGQDRQAYLRGGRALERVWLTATSRGIAFQPMSSLPYLFARLERGGGAGFSEPQKAALAALRARYRALFTLEDGDAELLLFRLAIAGPPTRHSLRRRPEDLLRKS